MNQHDFEAIVAAIATTRAATNSTNDDGTSQQNLPTWQAQDWPEPSLEVHRLRIGVAATSELRFANLRAQRQGQPLPHPHPADDQNNYWAEAIRYGKRYFYCVGDTLIECSVADYASVVNYPSLQYFSCAIPLHGRIKKVRAKEKTPSDFHPGKDSWSRRGDKHIAFKIAETIQEKLINSLLKNPEDGASESSWESKFPEAKVKAIKLRSALYQAIVEVLEAENHHLVSV